MHALAAALLLLTCLALPAVAQDARPSAQGDVGASGAEKGAAVDVRYGLGAAYADLNRAVQQSREARLTQLRAERTRLDQEAKARRGQTQPPSRRQPSYDPVEFGLLSGTLGLERALADSLD
jgi:hypothetical protein